MNLTILSEIQKSCWTLSPAFHSLLVFQQKLATVQTNLRPTRPFTQPTVDGQWSYPKAEGTKILLGNCFLRRRRCRHVALAILRGKSAPFSSQNLQLYGNPDNEVCARTTRLGSVPAMPPLLYFRGGRKFINLAKIWRSWNLWNANFVYRERPIWSRARLDCCENWEYWLIIETGTVCCFELVRECTVCDWIVSGIFGGRKLMECTRNCVTFWHVVFNLDFF